MARSDFKVERISIEAAPGVVIIDLLLRCNERHRSVLWTRS